jgi:hypothetical protein
MTDIVTKSKPKRLSKSTRAHTRRMKAEARETSAAAAKPLTVTKRLGAPS